MGYPAVNGGVNTNAPLAAISIPLMGQVQQPKASTTMSMTANSGFVRAHRLVSRDVHGLRLFGRDP